MNVGFGNERGVVEYLLQEVNKLKDNSGEGSEKGYKELTLLINQIGQNVPDIVVLSNENNYNIINISRNGVGRYEFELEGNPLPNNPSRSASSPQCYQDKVTFQCFNGQTAPNLRVGMDDSIVNLISYNDDNSALVDGEIYNTLLEIRVYD